jgi:U3 small nucleolar RNA-associated protein 12
MDALDLVDNELAELDDFNARIEAGGASSKAKKQSNPLLLGLTPHKYMIRSLRLVKAPDLEQALLILPFHYVARFITILLEMAKKGLDLELCTRCSVFLLRCHQSQIVSTQSLLTEMLALQQVLRTSVGSYRMLIGTNVAGLKYMQRMVDENKGGLWIEDTVPNSASQGHGKNNVDKKRNNNDNNDKEKKKKKK